MDILINRPNAHQNYFPQIQDFGLRNNIKRIDMLFNWFI